MSLPISIGDVIAAAALAKTIFGRIRSAPKQFQTFGRDVAVARTVLLDIQSRYAMAEERWLLSGPAPPAVVALNRRTIKAVFNNTKADLEKLGRKLDQYGGRVGRGSGNWGDKVAFVGSLPELKERLQSSSSMLFQLERLLQRDELAANQREILDALNEQRAEERRLRAARVSDPTHNRPRRRGDDATLLSSDLSSSRMTTRDAFICRWRSHVAAVGAAAVAAADDEVRYGLNEQRAEDERLRRTGRVSDSTDNRPRRHSDDVTRVLSSDLSSSSTPSRDALNRNQHQAVAADAAADDDTLRPEAQPTYYQPSSFDKEAVDGGGGSGSGSTSRDRLYSGEEIVRLGSATTTLYPLFHVVLVPSTVIMWIVAFGLAAQRTASAHEFSMVSYVSRLPPHSCFAPLDHVPNL